MSKGGVTAGLPLGGGGRSQQKAEAITAERGVNLLDPFVRIDNPIRFERLRWGIRASPRSTGSGTRRNSAGPVLGQRSANTAD